MTLVSVFTPSHDPKFLDDCYESLCAQTYAEWEWVILLNGEASSDRVKYFYDGDSRVEVRHASDGLRGVGAFKAETVSYCHGDILLELDHDDVLIPTAIEKVVIAFDKEPDLGMVYSQHAQIDTAGEPYFTPFSMGYGWRYRTNPKGHTYPLAMEPTPHNVSYIWYAPNHLRAFTRSAYEKAGGYDPALDILDDQDLMSRLYQVGEFRLIDEVLYFQRTHDGNTQKDGLTNARIQVETVNLYDRYIQPNALAWAKRRGLFALDLGGVHNKPEGYTGVDQHPGSDIIHTFPAPLPDFEFEDGKGHQAESSCGVIRAVDFLEHVEDKIAMMNEIHRLLAPGGVLLSMTPSTDGRGAWQDPTHVAGWNENSFWYYTDPQYANFVPEIKAKFQVSRVFTDFPSEWHRQHNIPYVFANLIAIKEGTPRNGGELLWA